MMTQADILSQNEEYGYDQSGDSKNILSSFTTFTANPTTNNADSHQADASVNFERPRNLEFGDLNAPSYLNEQSPIRPSKYLAADRYFIITLDILFKIYFN